MWLLKMSAVFLALNCLLAEGKPSENATQSFSLSEKAGGAPQNDKNIQKRVGGSQDAHDHHGERYYYREQPTVYQRTMIRNPEDAFTQTIQTNFQCPRGRPGYYADVPNGCRVFHICHEYIMPNGEPHSVRYSQFCPPGTIFDQLTLTCNFVYAAVPCGSANQFFYVNANLYQPSTQFISDADVQRGRSFTSNNYRTEQYQAPVSTYTRVEPTYTRTEPTYTRTEPTYTPSRHPSTIERYYETTGYVRPPTARPVYSGQTSTGNLHYNTQTTNYGSRSDAHVERNYIEPRTKFAQPASVGERLEVGTPQRVVARTESYSNYATRQNYRTIPTTTTVYPSQVGYSTYAPHMGFLGFLPIERERYSVARSLPARQLPTSTATFQSYDSRHPTVVSQVDKVVQEIQPPRYVKRPSNAYETTQRPLISPSEFPGFRQNGFRSSLEINHHAAANSHDHHAHHEDQQSVQVTSDVPVTATVTRIAPNSLEKILPAVPVVPVTSEKRPNAAKSSEEVIEEVFLDKKSRNLERFDLGRRELPDTGFTQEPVVVRGGRKSKTLILPGENSEYQQEGEVPYLKKRTARSHKEFVEPAFKGASAIPGIIPEEYLVS